jgi:hypothetical protein
VDEDKQPPPMLDSLTIIGYFLPSNFVVIFFFKKKKKKQHSVSLSLPIPNPIDHMRPFM